MMTIVGYVRQRILDLSTSQCKTGSKSPSAITLMVVDGNRVHGFQCGLMFHGPVVLARWFFHKDTLSKKGYG